MSRAQLERPNPISIVCMDALQGCRRQLQIQLGISMEPPAPTACAHQHVLHACRLNITTSTCLAAAGEYGLTSALMKYGYNVDTLMAMYRGVSACK